ncbi:hypothetical protein RI528_00100 [Aeromonas veronii]|uniref:hypothetical protein n=1 Tax=Aeromonas TaxID=642 RepID=UPI0034229843
MSFLVLDTAQLKMRVFDMLTIKSMLAVPGMSSAVHNAKLLDVWRGDDGHETLLIEHGREHHELVGGGQWSEEHSRRDVGKVGYIVPALPFSSPLPVGACYFRAYIDQSLRRVPELDSNKAFVNDGRAPEVIGWRCDFKPTGFLAPVGLIPGENGMFVPDETQTVTLRVPPEFLRECTRVQMTAHDLLRSFVGDLAGIRNYAMRPRADGYGSGGSDEREYADAWLMRAHGHNAVDLDEIDAAEDALQETQFLLDDFAGLIDDFESQGGSARDLFEIVRQVVDNKKTEAGETN